MMGASGIGGSAARTRAKVATGLQTRKDLLANGFTDSQIRRAVRTGDLIRVVRGVYGTVRSSAPAGVDQRAHEYCQLIRSSALCGDDPLISHASAAALHKLPLVEIDRDVVHVTQQARSGGQRRGRVFRHLGAAAIEQTRIDGIRVTSVPRTLVDLARTNSFRSAVAAIDAALHDGSASKEQLADEVRSAAGRSGAAAARRAIEFADGLSESPGESLTRAALCELGFPPPQLQMRVLDRHGVFLGRVDLAYLELGLLIEFDGLVKYGGLVDGPDARTALIREKRREDGLRSSGFIVLRLTWSDLNRPAHLHRMVSEAIEQAVAAKAAGLMTGTITL